MSAPSGPWEDLRAQFPSLQRRHNGSVVAYFDGPAQSQTVRSSVQAMRDYMLGGSANLHGAFVTSLETAEIVRSGRHAIARFLNADDDEVAFGANMTTICFALSRALARAWEPGDEVVVSEMDHHANIDPWMAAAAERGATARWIPVDTDTVTLDLRNLDEIINQRTRLVAVGLASNATGTVHDVARIADRAHRVGAVVAVDAVHAAAHLLIDRDALGADVLMMSGYKVFGPHVGIAAIRRELFDRIQPYNVEPAPDEAPATLETGAQNHEGIAGLREAILFLSSLGEAAASAPLRTRIVSGMRAIETHEAALAGDLRSALQDLPGVNLYSAPEGTRTTPTLAFTVDGYTPRQVSEHLASAGCFVTDGDFYASTLANRLGTGTGGGWVRAGLAPYNTRAETERLVAQIKLLVGRGTRPGTGIARRRG